MPGHARSFSNDRAALPSLEPRRTRRGFGNEPSRPSPNQLTSDQYSRFYQTAQDEQGESSSAGAAAVTMVDTQYHDQPRDAESLRPLKLLSPIDEKPLHPPQEKKNGKVTWSSLPRKDQLAILFIGRLVDFLQVASLQAYVFYQLKSFDRSLSDAQISQQAGLLQGCFTGAQVLTAILWGKAADASWCGRKWVLVIGLGGTAISCLGYGFATTFFWAAFWRVFGGAINGTVGIM